MKRGPPVYTLTCTLFPNTTLVRSQLLAQGCRAADAGAERDAGRGAAEPQGIQRRPARPIRAAPRALDRAQRAPHRRHRIPRHAEAVGRGYAPDRSEEHTSELQSLMRISYAVFCLKKTKKTHT